MVRKMAKLAEVAMRCWEIKKCGVVAREKCEVFTTEMAAMEQEAGFINCWDFKGCEESKRNQCVAFINRQGQECWMLTGTLCNENEILEFKEKMKICKKCEFFKKHANKHI
ncbi:MAG: hypothetical protein L7F77_04030 [Candidatus Magnetominusculus sp. LBB02]|nr:hypothetical protein [Candidatus Magnetominusculus sp. LBB02]